MFVAVLVFTGFVSGTIQANAQERSNPRVARAVRFLDSTKRSKDILSYIHMGGTFQDYEIVSIHKVVDRSGDPVPGHFAVKVVYDWTTAFGDNSTTTIFYFDEMGQVTDIKADTTSIINQPFAVARAAINVVGNILIGAFGDQMKPEDKREFQRFVDAADAKGLLIFSLNFQMRAGL